MLQGALAFVYGAPTFPVHYSGRSLCQPKSTLVRSLPVGNFSISLAPGALPTWQALGELVNQTHHTLDFTAMYMDLLGTDVISSFALQLHPSPCS